MLPPPRANLATRADVGPSARASEEFVVPKSTPNAGKGPPNGKRKVRWDSMAHGQAQPRGGSEARARPQAHVGRAGRRAGPVRRSALDPEHTRAGHDPGGA